MEYRWKALLEREEREETVDGSITRKIVVEKQGTVVEIEAGQNVAIAIAGSTRKIGNLIHLEIERIR